MLEKIMHSRIFIF